MNHGDDQGRRQSVFVSHARGRETGKIEALLVAAGLQAFDWKHIPPGIRWTDSLSQALDKCYALVAFADDANLSTAIPLEIGVALGMGKPVVLLVEEAADVTRAPVALRDLPYVTVGQNVQKAAERLRIELESANPGHALGPTDLPWRHPDFGTFDSVIERDVALALGRAGVRVAVHPRVDAVIEADLAAWFPDLAPAMNPVIIEVKGGLVSKAAVVSDVRSWLERLQLLFGMVVTGGMGKPEWHIDHGKAILTIGLERLGRLSSNELRALLNDGRNQLVHGRP
ncbi:TIR domain-containing protein [Micromonospora sp. DPT]|uniref:TIR domain-containing protein n=1 Tax=Micromonospora sp. DPT TaxID=3142975 RepID=UPI003208BC3E